MRATDQPRDTWGRWTARPGGRSTPEKPQAAPLFKEGTREVHLTKERVPHYQVWDGDTLVSEKPATRTWKRDQDEAVAIARGAPRDTANLVGLSATSHNAVINSILRGARFQSPTPATLRPKSKGEQELANLIAENMRRENGARSLDEIRRDAEYVAASFAQSGSAAIAREKARQLQAQQEHDERDEDAAREAEIYE